MALVVFTGGARSGKSAAATELARVRALDGVNVMVAVFGDPHTDDEMALRIARHQADRPEGFAVIEATDGTSWLSDVPEDALLLVDCLGTMVSRIMADAGPECSLDAIEPHVHEILSRLIRRNGDVVVVTNEVGEGVVPAYASGRVFRDILGRANQVLVNAADAAYLVVAGHLIDLAVLPKAALWPTD